MKIGQSAGKGFAYLLGVYLGDGCVTRNIAKGKYEYQVFRLNTIDEDFALATKAALESFTTRPVYISKHSVKKSTKPNWSISQFEDPICKALIEHTKSKLEIPGYVFTWPKELQLEFVAGLMDSEGYASVIKRPYNVVTVTPRGIQMGFKSCDAWFFEFVRLLEMLGVRIGQIGVEQPRKEGYKVPRFFRIKIQSWIDAGCYFKIKRKQERIELWGRSIPYAERSRFPRRPTSETTRRTPEGDDIVRSV